MGLTNIGPSVLSRYGINPIAIGTPEELRREGIDTEAVGSCAPARQNGIRGCPLWDKCPFHLKKMGSFKGSGPAYVGYFVQTHEGDVAEDFMACHAFVRTMLGRMKTARIQQEEGDSRAEIIRIVAIEPRLAERTGLRTFVRKRHEIPVETDPVRRSSDLRGVGQYKEVFPEVKIPNWPRPGENPQETYSQILYAQEKERQRKEDDAEDDAFVAAMIDAEDRLQPEAEKRRGRPPKVKPELEGLSAMPVDEVK